MSNQFDSSPILVLFSNLKLRAGSHLNIHSEIIILGRKKSIRKRGMINTIKVHIQLSLKYYLPNIAAEDGQLVKSQDKS